MRSVIFVFVSRRGLSLERPLESSEKKKSASESNLLAASGAIETLARVSAIETSDEFPAPPNEDELQRMSISATLETVTGVSEGFYRSFDDLDDIDDHLMSVLADSNPLEAAVVLRGTNNGTNPVLNGSENGNNGRNSFNSSDSGRMSNDTYAETSNSSVASSSGGNSNHNRLHSNMSNCSGDSGAQLSLNSNDSKVLEVLKEQESPDLSPFDQEIYGTSVSISASGSSKKSGNANSENIYHEPRFATVRKSHTLPHGMNSVASTPTVLTPRKRKDLGTFLGLNDDGPGSPSKEVAQNVAMQNLPRENCNEKIEKYLGIKTSETQKRPRPKVNLKLQYTVECFPKVLFSCENVGRQRDFANFGHFLT